MQTTENTKTPKQADPSGDETQQAAESDALVGIEQAAEAVRQELARGLVPMSLVRSQLRACQSRMLQHRLASVLPSEAIFAPRRPKGS